MSSIIRKLIILAFSYRNNHQFTLDAPERTIRHSHLIHVKQFLYKLYTEWYSTINELLPEHLSGCLVELGSGGGFAKRIIKGAVTTEILAVPNIDLRLDGQVLPFKDASLKGIFMIDVFHHLPCAEKFLEEAARCIKPEGVVVMIEPWNTPFSRVIYRHLHHEPFLSDTKKWQLPIGGPLSQANSALPWIVFKRDRQLFERKFPQWQIKPIDLHTPFRYLLSGGLSVRSLMPGAFFESCRNFEKSLKPLMNYIALFATIVLVRKEGR